MYLKLIFFRKNVFKDELSRQMTKYDEFSTLKLLNDLTMHHCMYM